MSNFKTVMNSPSKFHQSFIYKNTHSLSDDLRNITESPELCDVKFLVGKDSVPIYGVKSILATRNRLLFSLILAQQKADVLEKKHLKRQQTMGHKMKNILQKLTKADKNDKKREYSKHLQIVLKSFEPKIFKKVMDHIMSGKVKVDVKSVIGVMEAAVQFGIEDLRDACYLFAREHITKKCALPLFASIDNSGFSKWTRYIRHEILIFISTNAENLLQYKAFGLLPRRSALQILSLPDLQASDETKRTAIENWELQNQGEQLLHPQDKSTISNLPLDFKISITELIDQAELLHTISMTMYDQSFQPNSNKSCHAQREVSQKNDRQVSEISRRNKRAIPSSAVLKKNGDDNSLDRAFLCSSAESSLLSE